MKRWMQHDKGSLPRLLTALVLVCALLLTQTGCMTSYLLYRLSEEEEAPAYTAAPRESVRFSDMAYVRPDVEAIRGEWNALKNAMDTGEEGADALLARYEAALASYEAADSACSLAYLLYAFDITEPYYQDEYDTLSLELNELDLLMTEVSIALFSSETAGDAAESAYGGDFVDAIYAGERLNSLDVQPLFDEEQKLTFDYDALLTAYAYREKGKSWTSDSLYEAVMAGELEYTEYVRLYDAYCAGLNREAGAIYRELLTVRSRIADSLGFASYAEYGYELYGRDYTPKEAKALHAAVKRYLVPLYVRASDAHYDETSALYDLSFGQERFFQKLMEAAASFDARLAESLGYLLDNELYDFTVSENKMEGSFTTYLSQYRAPFIFSQWLGTSADQRTVIHELGHFTNYYENPDSGWNGGSTLDLAEIDSQGLELLMMPYYDAFYGKRAAAARVDMLLDALYAVVTGCMEDEFQQTVYENPAMTLAEMNALYKKLAVEYGMEELYGYTGTEWVLVHHTFQSPMYYISYAVSMLGALELWQRAEGDREGATDVYFAILNRPEYAVLRDTLEENALSDPLDAGTVQRLAAALKTALQ